MRFVKRVSLAVLLVLAAGAVPARADRWGPPVRERVVSSPFTAGGYPGAAPAPGTCIGAPYDANVSESVLAVRPGSEQLAGAAKAYFNKWSTFKAYHNASFAFGDGQGRPTTQIIGGFDCVTTGTQAMPPSWTNATDPNLAWDRRGRLHQVALPFNAYWGSVDQPNGDVYGIFSDDGGRTWQKGNGGAPIQAGPNPSTQSLDYLDKPWVAVNQVRGHRWADHVYGAWVQFNDDAGLPPEIKMAVSRDRGATWSAPQTVPTPVALGPSNPWPHLAVGADGALQLTYVTYGDRTDDGALKVSPATIWSARSDDDGVSWSTSTPITTTTVIRSCCLPGTQLHDGVVEFMDTSREQPGHAYVTYESYTAGQLDVMLSATRDGGRTWSAPVSVGSGPFDQFQPEVAAGPDGAVVVAFYDKRFACPAGPAVLPENRGKLGVCLTPVVQAYRDTGARLVATAPQLPVSRTPWDPEQPAQHRDGLGQLPCENPEDPCGETFVGDYFGLAVTRKRVQVLSASTAHPSGVRADEGGPIYYQQQVLATVQRRALGLAHGHDDESR